MESGKELLTMVTQLNLKTSNCLASLGRARRREVKKKNSASQNPRVPLIFTSGKVCFVFAYLTDSGCLKMLDAGCCTSGCRMPERWMLDAESEKILDAGCWMTLHGAKY